MDTENFPDAVADTLARLYSEKFGGKDRGRYRVAARAIRDAAGRRRLYENDVQALARAMVERGYVLIDMDTFFVVMSANAFLNYRRANDQCLEDHR
jgi:hypothetical protein